MDPSYPIQSIPLSRIRPPADPLRVTIDPERIAALADDIAAQGLLQPIGVRGPDGADFYEVVWGHRRFLAHQLLVRGEIEAKIFPWTMDPLHAMAMENLGQEPMSAIEEALTCHRYVAKGQPIAAIARILRHSDAWVNARLELLAYPQDVQEAVQAKQISLAVAEQLAQIDHDELRVAYIAEADRTGAKASTVAIWLAHFRADRDRIISNHLRVEEIAAQRADFVLYVRCDPGNHDVPMKDSRTIRGCQRHLDELMKAIDLAASPA